MNPVANFNLVRERIAATALRGGRDPETIRLLPVSKMVSAGVIASLYDAGVREFGENRIAVLAEKYEILPKDIRWHFIGQLQANKVRKVVRIASVIHSADSPELVERIDRIAPEEGKRPEVLLEISVSGEECKGGFPVARVMELAQCAAECRNIDWRGMMTMAPLEADEATQRMVFDGLRSCRDELERCLNRKLPVLSMGMSRDMDMAITCGSTLVRVGTAIFS